MTHYHAGQQARSTKTGFGATLPKYPKRTQYKYAKKPYKVRNWAQYEAGLCRRGDVTIRLPHEAIQAWRAPASRKPGGQRRYSAYEGKFLKDTTGDVDWSAPVDVDLATFVVLAKY